MKKRAVTLVEMMIVISLIAIIGGVLSYNLTGALDKGRAFKTQQAQNQIREALQLVYSEKNGEISFQEIEEHPEEFLKASGIVKDPEELIKDGWGAKMQVKFEEEQEEFKAISENLEKYNQKNKLKKKDA